MRRSSTCAREICARLRQDGTYDGRREKEWSELDEKGRRVRKRNTKKIENEEMSYLMRKVKDDALCLSTARCRPEHADEREDVAPKTV